MTRWMLATRQVVVLTALVLAVGVWWAPAASADVDRLDSYRNCDVTRAGYTHKIKISRIPQTHGDGTYYLKSRIIWEAQIGTDRWREYDRNDRESPHYYIDNPNFIFTMKHGDATNWGNAYGRFWRAKIVVKLMKERKGPDATKETDERFFTKNVFREVGSNCHLTRTSGWAS